MCCIALSYYKIISPVTALLPPSTGPAPVTVAGLLVDALAAISPAAAAEAPDRPAATAAMQVRV